MVRRFILQIFAGIIAFGASAQTIDEKIGNAMNASDWFALDSIYSAVSADSINPFLEIYSRCLIGNRLNRPDLSVPAFQELLNTQQLGLDILVSSAHMFGMDLSRLGYNAEAASMINSIVAQTNEYLDSASIESLTEAAGRFSALSQYNPYQIEFPQSEDAIIPFTILPVGPKDKDSVHMHLTGCTINGREADITFDTGAGVNILSHQMAEKYQLIPLEGAKITVSGFGKSEGYLAIAPELRLGNIVIKDVPFVVASLSSHNDEADSYIDSFNTIVGSELMLRLKDLTVDFASGRIIVNKDDAPRKGISPNLCFSSGMNLLTKCVIAGTPTLSCLDSGDAAFGSLSPDFFDAHKEYITSVGVLDTIRTAGVGGVYEQQCYRLPDVDVCIGGNTVKPEYLIVKTVPDRSMDYEARIGLRTMMLFSKIHFNMRDFVITTEK